MKEEKMITASNKEVDEAKVAKNDNIPTITMNCEY